MLPLIFEHRERLQVLEAHEDAEDEAYALEFEQAYEAGQVETVSLEEYRRFDTQMPLHRVRNRSCNSL